MTLQEVKNMQLGITENGSLALCTEQKNGKMKVVRPITAEEMALITLQLYNLHQSVHPEQSTLVLPTGKENVTLAVTAVTLKQ